MARLHVIKHCLNASRRDSGKLYEMNNSKSRMWLKPLRLPVLEFGSGDHSTCHFQASFSAGADLGIPQRARRPFPIGSPEWVMCRGFLYLPRWGPCSQIPWQLCSGTGHSPLCSCAGEGERFGPKRPENCPWLSDILVPWLLLTMLPWVRWDSKCKRPHSLKQSSHFS